jgi:hypothetical protein
MQARGEPVGEVVRIDDREQPDRDPVQHQEREHREVEALREHLDDHARRGVELAEHRFGPRTEGRVVVPRRPQIAIRRGDRVARPATRARDRVSVAKHQRCTA